MEISNRYINRPEQIGWDGLGLDKEQYYYVHDCIIDLSSCSLKFIDEAVGITQGAHGLFERCLIRGAGKNILCGCGDDPKENPKVLLEKGKNVVFKYCVFEDSCRRMPEVQDGMTVTLSHCLVRNWGLPSRFDTRAFGAWAHNGGEIRAQHTIFHQTDFYPGFWCWLKDHIGHFGQAINDYGFWRGIFHRDAWLSGYRRGLTAGPEGKVTASNLYVTDKRIVIDADYTSMSDIDYAVLYNELTLMVDRLVETLVGGKDNGNN